MFTDSETLIRLLLAHSSSFESSALFQPRYYSRYYSPASHWKTADKENKHVDCIHFQINLSIFCYQVSYYFQWILFRFEKNWKKKLPMKHSHMLVKKSLFRAWIQVFTLINTPFQGAKLWKSVFPDCFHLKANHSTWWRYKKMSDTKVERRERKALCLVLFLMIITA